MAPWLGGDGVATPHCLDHSPTMPVRAGLVETLVVNQIVATWLVRYLTKTRERKVVDGFPDG